MHRTALLGNGPGAGAMPDPSASTAQDRRGGNAKYPYRRGPALQHLPGPGRVPTPGSSAHRRITPRRAATPQRTTPGPTRSAALRRPASKRLENPSRTPLNASHKTFGAVTCCYPDRKLPTRHRITLEYETSRASRKKRAADSCRPTRFGDRNHGLRPSAGRSRSWGWHGRLHNGNWRSETSRPASRVRDRVSPSRSRARRTTDPNILVIGPRNPIVYRRRKPETGREGLVAYPSPEVKRSARRSWSIWSGGVRRRRARTPGGGPSGLRRPRGSFGPLHPATPGKPVRCACCAPSTGN